MPDEEGEYTTADWLDWVPDLMDAIAEGHFDSVLKQLVKVAYTRGKQVEAEGGQIPSAKAAYVEPAPVAAYAGPIVGEGGIAQLGWTYSNQRSIVFKDKYYSKAHIEGHAFRIRSAGASWYLDGLVVKVVTCGTKFAQVMFVDDPTSKYPSSHKLRELWKRQQATNSPAFKIPYNFIGDAFQTN